MIFLNYRKIKAKHTHISQSIYFVSFVLDMTDYQLSNEDHEALEKFTKFFLVKSAQIIVQSRLGEKKTTKSKSVCSGNEWVSSNSNNNHKKTISISI